MDDVDTDGRSTDEVLPVSSSQTSGSNGDQALLPISCTLAAADDAVDQASIPTPQPSSAPQSSWSPSNARITPVDIVPYPKCELVEKRKRRAQRAEVLTSSPYKKALEEKSNKEITKRQSKNTQERKKRNTDKVRMNQKQKSSQKNESSDTTPCGVCGVKYSDDVRERNGKKWIECIECATWYHNECQGLARPPRGTFICISCEN